MSLVLVENEFLFPVCCPCTVTLVDCVAICVQCLVQ